jgi:phosphoglucosamine mutase
MTRKIFGTDGVRGKANEAPMTPDLVMRLAISAGQQFLNGNHRHMVVIGKDTRLSGYMIEPALTAGFVSVGMDVTLVGPLPTPAIAMLTRSLRADLGVVISASHNPYEDNGVKFFGRDGYKLSDTVENQIEARIQTNNFTNLASAADLGRARRLDDAQGRYIEFVKNTLPKNIRLDGLKIVIDCANGAAYQVAPLVLWELGAEIISLGVNPNGCNINLDCGATNVESMRQAVIEHGADLGISLDGDADRVVMVDEKGCIIDGDQLMAVIATSWYHSGLLQGNGVVATLMSNLGLEQYLKNLNLKLYRTAVGDRYVSATMREKGCNVGGEQSGHIILSDHSTTGDGLIAALQVLAVIVQLDKPASKICQVFKPIPQILKNIHFDHKQSLENTAIQTIIQQTEKKLGKNGRLLIRKSGTEPLLRIMAEGENEEEISAMVDQIITVIQAQTLIKNQVA